MKPWMALCCLAAALPAAEEINVPIENDQVKVLKVTVQPHEKTKLHQHKVNRVMVYMGPARQEFTTEGGKKSVVAWKAGEANWSPAGGMHIAEVVSDQPLTIAEVELKKPGRAMKITDPLDPVRLDPTHYHVEFENDQVRVLRVKMGAKQSAPMHAHTLNRVIVYLTDQKIRVTGSDGKVETPEHKAGDITWAAPTKHREENVGDKAFEVVVVELKS